MVRERLAEVIQHEPDLVVCGEAESRQQALEIIPVVRPHLAIIDLTLKDSHGLDLIKDIRVRHPALLMLVVSMHDELLHGERVIRAGAHGYITKQEATRNVLNAIRTVLNGGVYFSERMATHIAAGTVGQPKPDAAPSLDSLSDRELRVYELIGRGHRIGQIASALNVDVTTVQTYCSRIKEKLNLKDADELRQHAVIWTRGQNSA